MAFVTPVVEHWLEREIAQWVHPIKDRSDDPPLLLIEDPMLLIGKSSPLRHQRAFSLT